MREREERRGEENGRNTGSEVNTCTWFGDACSCCCFPLPQVTTTSGVKSTWDTSFKLNSAVQEDSILLKLYVFDLRLVTLIQGYFWQGPYIKYVRVEGGGLCPKADIALELSKGG